MILIASKGTLTSAWPHQEVGYFIAMKSKKRVFVILRSNRQFEARQLGVLHGKENIRADRLRRTAQSSSVGKNEFSWECALDKLTSLLLRKRLVTVNRGRIRLRGTIPCCGTMKRVDTSISIREKGRTIIVEPYVCPTHRKSYNHDPLTWALLPAQELSYDALEVAERRSFEASPDSRPLLVGGIEVTRKADQREE
jgi:hypothetical protein